MRCRAAEGARLPAAMWLSGGVKGPTNTSSFLHVQQGGEVEAVPNPAAAHGRGARGLWLSETRQAGGHGESALSFHTDALPESVGAQRVRQGAYNGQGRTQRGHDFTQTNRGPMGLYLTPLCFNTNSPERKSSPFGGGGGGKSGLCCLGAQSSTQGVGWVQAASRQGKMAPRMTQCMAQRPGRKACSSVGASSSLWWGAVQTPPPSPG